MLRRWTVKGLAGLLCWAAPRRVDAVEFFYFTIASGKNFVGLREEV